LGQERTSPANGGNDANAPTAEVEQPDLRRRRQVIIPQRSKVPRPRDRPITSRAEIGFPKIAEAANGVMTNDDKASFAGGRDS
jgi:hypothetical protein